MSAKFNVVYDTDVLKYFKAIKEQYHPRLRDSRIQVIWREDADFGHITLAQVAAPINRFLEQIDAYLFVHKGAWKDNLNEQQKAYWMDHALCMLYALDKIGDDGRPKLTIIQPEKIGYSDAIKRHGMVTENLKRVRVAVLESAQVNIFDLLEDVRVEEFAYTGFNADDAVEAAGTEALAKMLNDPKNEMFIQAARLIMEEQRASIQFLQRRLKVGYFAAAVLMDKLEAAGFVGPFNGSKTRDIKVTEDMLAFYESAYEEETQEVAVTAEQETDEEGDNRPTELDIFQINDTQEPPQPGLEA